jgi:hypothetical protein
MNFKVINKKNLSIIIVLLLVLVLSQSNFFNLLTNTVLGRALLIAILIIASYLNKILGVVCVLLVVIMVNNSNSIYLEGATTMNATDSSGNSITTKTAPSTAVAGAASTPAAVTTTPAASTPPAPAPAAATSLSNVIATATGTKSTAQEGFDIIGKERNIQKGRNSNSIPVNDFMRESVNVAPYEGSQFTESFAIY